MSLCVIDDFTRCSLQTPDLVVLAQFWSSKCLFSTVPTFKKRTIDVVFHVELLHPCQAVGLLCDIKTPCSHFQTHM